MENATTVLFGLPGVVVLGVDRGADEHGAAARLVHVVAAVSSVAGCPECGVVAGSVKQYRTTWPRDLPYGEEPLAVRWRKRQYRCREEPRPCAVLGIDETRRGKPKWVKDAGTGRWARTERFETNFTGLAGDGRLLGPGRRAHRHGGHRLAR
jgi:transposase